MERIEQPTTAVPVEVQKVLDAMTEENWLHKAGFEYVYQGKACFYGRFNILSGAQNPNETPHAVTGTPLDYMDDLCMKKHGCFIVDLNDKADDLSDFKSKIIALYGEVKP